MCQLRSHMGQTCLEASLPEEEGEGFFRSVFLLLAPAFYQTHWTTEGPSWRKGDALAETGLYQKSRGEGGAEQRVSWQL